ncbi:type II toxin-antitoxin system VapC family toxin [Rhizobium sp.]
MILVDSNVLLDVIRTDPVWAAWSMARLDEAAGQYALVINAVIYSELAVGYATMEQLDEFIESAGLQVLDIPRPALFLASKAFLAYRRSGGTRTGVLPDFFIGAHAATLGIPVITRDIRRYRTYFPAVELISPASPN